MRELAAQGHEVLFLERDVPWYASNRDLPRPLYGRTELYQSLEDLTRFENDVRDADAVIVGSYVPEGVKVGEWVLSSAEGLTAFYDIDTPVTLAKLGRGETDYLSPDLIPRYDLYLSFTGGPTLQTIFRALITARLAPGRSTAPWTRRFITPKRRTCAGTWAIWAPTARTGRGRWRGCCSSLPARHSKGRYIVAGPLYPDDYCVAPKRYPHRAPAPRAAPSLLQFAQRFTLNVTRADMIRAGYAPSVRLFEAAACGVPIISDTWDGLETFFELGKDILLAHSPEDTLAYLEMDEGARLEVGARARARVLGAHTAAHRAEELVGYLRELRE